MKKPIKGIDRHIEQYFKIYQGILSDRVLGSREQAATETWVFEFKKISNPPGRFLVFERFFQKTKHSAG
jgi:hypothetical protein